MTLHLARLQARQDEAQYIRSPEESKERCEYLQREIDREEKSIEAAAIQEQPAGSGATHGWTGTCCENGNMGQPHICCKSPGNLPPNVVDLRTRMFKLDRLLLDPHPGLSTWVAAYGNAAKHLLQFFDEANAIPDAPGSPRKVGEEGALSEAEMREAFRKWWDESDAATQKMTMFQRIRTAFYAGAALARPSSVPVGEQKQEEGV